MESHWIIEKPAGLNHPKYFKIVLTAEWKPTCVLHWRRGFAFVFIGEEKLLPTSRLIKIRFEQ